MPPARRCTIVSVATMMLYEEGRLFLADPVSRYLPPLGKREVGVERVDPGTGKAVFATVPAEREMTIYDLPREPTSSA